MTDPLRSGAAGVAQGRLQVQTRGRSLVEISSELEAWLARCGLQSGLLNVFIRHTSASLILCENADPDVLVDLQRYMADLVADGDPRFVHTAEGPDDMAAHVRSVLTASSLSIPLLDGRLALGAWQGVFVWEHRHQPHRRELVLSAWPAV